MRASPISSQIQPAIVKEEFRPRSEKISESHLERNAIVYIRQSTPQQLLRNQESTQVQYNLKHRAVELGWSEAQVVVIDDDLGKSGASSEERKGFQRLVAEVTLNRVGVILGVEMSRLARSCKDWYQLLEVCGVFRTLIADLDGVYDPAQYNDRLLLGLKGTMSEAELHILRQRMDQGKLNKARRADLISHVPIGYQRRPSGEVTKDPDEEVQEIVRLVFSKFEELGSLHGTLLYLARHKILLPVRLHRGPEKGNLEWHRPSASTVCGIVKNPMYAGVYTYGRRRVDPRKKRAGHPGSGRVWSTAEGASVFLKDKFPAYISWEQYQLNRERIQANRANGNSAGAPKQGRALLAGLLVCGNCGARLQVKYFDSNDRHKYYCCRLRDRFGGDRCQSMTGGPLDHLVAQEMLKALAPASLELSMEAAGHIERQRRDLDSLWQKRLERAAYETDRAARHYRQVEPENRLVARELAREWESKLSQQKQLQDEHERILRTLPTALRQEDRETIRRLAEDIPALWTAPHVTSVDRKEILRQVVDHVKVQVQGDTEIVLLEIQWAGGRTTEHKVVRPVARWEQLSYWPELVKRLNQLAGQKLSDAEMVRRLNEEGWRPPKRAEQLGTSGLRDLFHKAGLLKKVTRSRQPRQLMKDEWRLADLARELEMPLVTLYTWMKRGWVKASRQERSPWILWADGPELSRLKSLRSSPACQTVRQQEGKL